MQSQCVQHGLHITAGDDGPSHLLVSPLSLCNGPVKVVSHGNLSGQTFIHLRSECHSVHSHSPILSPLLCVCVCVCGGGGGIPVLVSL